jgi:RNA polymerase sigma-70 factor (ECF subfamily)
MDDGADLLARAQTGEVAAFDALVAPHLPKLRSFLYRLVAHPDDTNELVQDVSLQAFRKLASFPADSTFEVWLFSIAHRLALTHLRTRKQRWSETVQLEVNDRAAASEAFGAALGSEIDRPEFRYEVTEHIAYCFSCIGRSLAPEDSAAIILRDVLSVPERDAARIAEVSESAFRQRVETARRTMTEAFEGLCELTDKHGACNQCSTLRNRCSPDRQGPPVEPLGDASREGDEALFERRLEAARSADVADGSASRMHGVMLRFISDQADPPAPE